MKPITCLPRFFTALALSLSGVAVCATPPPAAPPQANVAPAQDAQAPPAIQWHDVTEWGIQGRGYADVAADFDRLPARAQSVVRDKVWDLSRHTTGMAVRFTTDATRIDVDYTLTSDSLDKPHMPATGVSGVDLYAKQDGKWRWASVVKPRENPVQTTLVEGLAPGQREYLLYLPLYNGVESLKIGVPASAQFQGLAPRDTKPILFYGTSITHGACASRPGMSFVNLLGRRLDRPMLNFGFSGNGKMEAEVAELLAELDPAVFVLDCMANTPRENIEPHSYNVVQIWRQAHPDTPIVMVESRSWSSSDLVNNREAIHEEKRAAMRRTFTRLQAEGVEDLYYVKGKPLLGDDHEATTDGSHPSDLGMMRYADALEPVLRQALGR